VRWDTSQLRSSECNVAGATSTPKEVILSFGVSRSRDPSHGELEVELLHRVIMDPVAASRLQQLLTKLVSEHELTANER
jgi:uncharacterized protein DUF3467